MADYTYNTLPHYISEDGTSYIFYFIPPKATDNRIGGIKTGFITDESIGSYAVQTDENGNAYVMVPIPYYGDKDTVLVRQGPSTDPKLITAKNIFNEHLNNINTSVLLGQRPAMGGASAVTKLILDGGSPDDEVVNRINATWDPDAGEFHVEIVSLTDRARYAAENERLWIVPEIMTGKGFSPYRSYDRTGILSPKYRKRYLEKNMPGNRWRMSEIENCGQKILLNQKKYTFLKNCLVIDNNYLACDNNDGIGHFVQYIPTFNIKIRFYLLNSTSGTISTASLSGGRFMKTHTQILEVQAQQLLI